MAAKDFMMWIFIGLALVIGALLPLQAGLNAQLRLLLPHPVIAALIFVSRRQRDSGCSFSCPPNQLDFKLTIDVCAMVAVDRRNFWR